MSKRPPRDPLMVRVCAELGAGRITEAYLKDRPGVSCDGYTDGKRITINPSHQTCDTVIHEILHRLFPAWSERYVRSRTTMLKNRMSDGEIQAFYAEYLSRVKRRKTPKDVSED